MIEALKDDKVINEMGGRFKFTALVQHRIRQLMDGARPLVDRKGRSDFEIAVQEIIEGKITYQLEGAEEPVPGMADPNAVVAQPITNTEVASPSAEELTAGIEAIAEAAQAAEAEDANEPPVAE
ncbi:RNA polymerase Rpb6 [Poriferisphaera corsica]|uniref:DNA-directed RNA polymerase subunit omega n=1 Tax=Poriferisphaera corsica TaxID=2528020 RepID=A0A517YUJ1_9BACT|nr:DNA-directed RNA polymerase subunit omega [Poriferisphaera corsica]QDU33832.1 RNA polymerase Rpb6 [Poriferisphaera corsica]